MEKKKQTDPQARKRRQQRILLIVLLVLAALAWFGRSLGGTNDAVNTGSEQSGTQDIVSSQGAEEAISDEEQSDGEQSAPDSQSVPDSQSTSDTNESAPEQEPDAPARDKSYTTPQEVALYLHLYGELPQNFITKQQAKQLGWDSSAGNLWEVADGKSIGGDSFGNYEGNLPEEKGRHWYECDVNYAGGYRGGERLLYSNDGLIYYTADHYETFTLLYTAEGAA